MLGGPRWFDFKLYSSCGVRRYIESIVSQLYGGLLVATHLCMHHELMMPRTFFTKPENKFKKAMPRKGDSESGQEGRRHRKRPALWRRELRNASCQDSASASDGLIASPGQNLNASFVLQPRFGMIS